MPIKGVSEVRQIPRIGKIRLGVKVAGQNSDYPKAVDYFVCVADQSTPEWAAKAFHAAYGDKPKTLDIMFPLNDTEKFFPQWYRRYGKGTGLICKGNGETAILRTESGDVEQKCDPENCEFYKKKLCRHIGTIQFLLPQVQGLGIWQIDTTSYHSIVNLNSGIDFVKGITGGRIAWLPLKLSVGPKEVAPDGKKKTVYVMSIDNEQVRMKDILEASRLKPIHLLLPDLNMDEAPDDLYPASVLNEETTVSEQTRQTQPAKPVEQPKQQPAPEPTTWKMTREHVTAACTIIKESGAPEEAVKAIFERAYPKITNEFGKLNWPQLTQSAYQGICELFSSGKWKDVFAAIQETNHDIEMPSLSGGARL